MNKYLQLSPDLVFACRYVACLTWCFFRSFLRSAVVVALGWGCVVLPDAALGQNAAITLATVPSGLLVSVDGGAAQAAPFTESLAAGTHTISVAATQAGGAGTQYVFTNWDDGGTASHSITVGTASATYTATFQTQYQFTTAASPSTGGTITPASGTYYNAGTVVSVQAAGNSGYQFGNFSGGVLSGSVTPQNVTMSGPVYVVANFTPIAPELTVGGGARANIADSTAQVNFMLSNSGIGAANNATVASVTPIAVENWLRHSFSGGWPPAQPRHHRSGVHSVIGSYI